MIGVLTALPFGARRAPANWGRLVLLLMTIAWHHFSLLVLDYVDDVNGVEPHFSAESARQTWVELVSLLGLTLDVDKCSSSASTCFDSLGVSWALSSPHALVQILPSRLAGLQDDIQAIVAANWLRPGHAARLRGKLGFALVAAFGRFGRAQLSAIKRRQYASGGKNFQLSAVLRAQLEWWLVHLRSLPGRGVPRSPAEIILGSLFRWRRQWESGGMSDLFGSKHGVLLCRGPALHPAAVGWGQQHSPHRSCGATNLLPDMA